MSSGSPVNGVERKDRSLRQNLGSLLGLEGIAAMILLSTMGGKEGVLLAIFAIMPLVSLGWMIAGVAGWWESRKRGRPS